MATMAAACVELTRPKVIDECAATNTCTDDSSGHPKRDARDDSNASGADVADADGPSTEPDGAPDGPQRDVAVDGRDGSVADADVAVSGDSRPEAEPDGVRQDGAADLGPDTGPDIRADVGSDLHPDVAPDLPPDLLRDLAPDVGPDVGRDLPPDLPPDTSTLGNGLVAYYKCESATGTTLPDSSGNNNNATLSASGFSFVTGKVSKALALAKANQAYVSLPPGIFNNAGDITIAAWVSVTTSQNWARLFDVGVNAKLASNTATGTHYLNLVPKNDGTDLMFAITNNGYSNEQKLTTPTPPVATWKHVAIVLGASPSGLYVDGASVADGASIALRPRDLGTIDYAYLGKSQFTSDPYLDGMLDEVRVYNRALTAAEIKALYQFAGP